LIAATHLQQRSPGTGTVAGQSWHSGSLSQSSPAKQQQFRLQLLQFERDRLKLRQQEIRMQQELMMRGSSNDLALDPFLTSLNDHSRQESADSGLGNIFTLLPTNIFMVFKINYKINFFKNQRVFKYICFYLYVHISMSKV
jgi:hypothetical protein